MRTSISFAGLRLFPLLSVLFAAGLTAQPAHLVKDIDDTTYSGGVAIGEMAAFGPSVYFGASSQASSSSSGDPTARPRERGSCATSTFSAGISRGGFAASSSGLFFFVGRELWNLDEADDTTASESFPTTPGKRSSSTTRS